MIGQTSPTNHTRDGLPFRELVGSLINRPGLVATTEQGMPKRPHTGIFNPVPSRPKIPQNPDTIRNQTERTMQAQRLKANMKWLESTIKPV